MVENLIGCHTIRFKYPVFNRKSQDIQIKGKVWAIQRKKMGGHKVVG